jgi:hypothetical protein
MSISSTFYKQLLRMQILKAQKDGQLDCLFVLLRSAHVKAASKMLMKLTQGLQKNCKQGKK